MNIHELLEKRVATITDIHEHLFFLRDFVNENGIKEIVEFGVREDRKSVV